MIKTIAMATLMLHPNVSSANSSDCANQVATTLLNHADGNITFQVENLSKTEYRTLQQNLPWGSRNSIQIIAMGRTNGRLIDSGGFPDDRVSDQIVLHPGQKLRGSINLLHYHPDIDKMRKEREWIVYWFHSAYSYSGQCVGADGGWFVLPKQREHRT